MSLNGKWNALLGGVLKNGQFWNNSIAELANKKDLHFTDIATHRFESRFNSDAWSYTKSFRSPDILHGRCSGDLAALPSKVVVFLNKRAEKECYTKIVYMEQKGMIQTCAPRTNK